MEKTLTEYISNVKTELTKTWRISHDRASRITLANIDILRDSFCREKPSWDMAVELGFTDQ